MLAFKLVFGCSLNQAYISVSLNNAQPMYYQPWNVTMSVRDTGLLERGQVAFKDGQGQRQEPRHAHPGCNKTFREEVMNQHFSHTRNLSHRNNK